MKSKKNRSQKYSRRKFLKHVTASAASAYLFAGCSTASQPDNSNDPIPEVKTYQPRLGVTNPFVSSTGKPILVCVRGTNFSDMLKKGLQELGGLSKLIQPVQNVLIKPNLNHSDPFPGISSPTSIADIVREVKQVTAGAITVGDEGYYPSSQVFRYLNLESVVEAAGGQAMSFAQTYPVRRSSWSTSKPDFRVYSHVYDSPVIINTCVIKHHNAADLSCAIKCNVGIIDGPWMTNTRQYLHRQSDNIFREIAEIARLVNPELNIVDARSILTVGGPFIQNGLVVDGVNRIVICGDIVATDAYCLEIMNEYDPPGDNVMQTLQTAEELGLGTADLNQVEILEVDS